MSTAITREQKQTSLEQLTEHVARTGLEVIGQGHLRRDNSRFFLVPSQSEAGRHHLVRLVGHRLRCDCRAAQFGKPCAHQAAAMMEIAHQSSNRVRFAEIVEGCLGNETTKGRLSDGASWREKYAKSVLAEEASEPAKAAPEQSGQSEGMRYWLNGGEDR